MAINPKTLEALRKKLGLSQQALADRSNVSKRTIARMEADNDDGADNVRHQTVENLAKALNVKPEELGKPPNEVDYATLRDWGYTQLKALVDDQTRLNYALAERHYGVSHQDLIDAAPWMFALLAEMSLAERRQRLEETKAAFDRAMELMPGHLNSHGEAARKDFKQAVDDEDASVSARDIFGKRVLETEQVVDPFNPDETNPFVDFLLTTAKSIGSDALEPQLLEFPGTGGLPHWHIFHNWFQDLTGGDAWARFAIARGYARTSEMPESLRGADRTIERAAWIAAQIPPEVREREDRRIANINLDIEL
jgi:transcriptional regulator with XRE-family HTH domain